jgi:hypothetical protein
MTLALFWTKIDIVQLSATEDNNEKVSKEFDTMIAVGTLCLIIKAFSYGFTYNHISLSCVMHLLADVIGAFFVFWIILDGWTWESYMVILIFCG